MERFPFCADHERQEDLLCAELYPIQSQILWASVAPSARTFIAGRLLGELAGVFVMGTNVNGLALDRHGSLFFSSAESISCGKIETMNQAGRIRTLVTGMAVPDGLAFDRNGDLYTAHYLTGQISKITMAGVISTFATGLVGPNDLTFDGEGNLYVANEGGNTISKITPDGVVKTFSTLEFVPTCLTFDSKGDLFVAGVRNACGNTVLAKISPDGHATPFLTGLPVAVTDLAIDAQDNLFVSGRCRNCDDTIIHKIAPTSHVAPPICLKKPVFLAFEHNISSAQQ